MAGDRDRSNCTARDAGRLFLVLVAFELAHTVAAIKGHRIPRGHDGFQFFTLQYYFLNDAIQSHQVAQWIPYMTQGTVATYWYGIAGSFPEQVLVHVSWLIRGVDLLAVYYVGMFADEMILLTGVWMLARRFFSTATVFFIAVSVVGSAVWLDQPYWNFRLYYVVPLVFELGHRFLDTGRWRWFLLAANLLAVQVIGNLPYFIPFTSFAVFTYFLLYVVVNPSASGRLRQLEWRLPAAFTIAASAISLLAAYKMLTIGTDQLVSHNPGRLADGSIDLNGFMTYGGATDPWKWADITLNISPWLDLTLYCGILLGPLLVCGAAFVDRRRLHLVLDAAVMLLFTLATPLSGAAFYLWPGMKYFRHIGLVSSFAKVLFCFVAGIGFEWLFVRQEAEHHRAVRASAIIGSAILLVSGLWAISTSRSSERVDRYIESVATPGIDRPDHMYDSAQVARRLRTSAAVAFAGAAVFGVVPLLLLGARLRPGTRRGIVFGVLAFVAADIYHFKFAYLIDRSDLVQTGERFVTRPSAMPYRQRRDRDLERMVTSDRRVLATLRFNRMLFNHFHVGPARGAQYWTNDAFFFADEVGSSLQTDSWLEPFDRLLRAYGGPDYAEGRLTFPVEPSAARIAGVTEDKIRFFSHAFEAAPERLASLVGDKSYEGNVLFVSPPEGRAIAVSNVEPWTGGSSLTEDDSLPLAYEVQAFDANSLTVKVNNPSPTGGWMSYADVWHPSWRATVNGTPVVIATANIAYKAVPIQPGENVVRFQFSSRLFSVLAACLAVNAAFWIVAVGWLAAGIVTATTSERQAPQEAVHNIS